MPFPQRFMEELLARSDIVDIVGGYVALKKRGGDYWACCPFHNEKTPSFSVSPDKRFYYCFGCKKGGSVVNFIMEMENLPYPEAVYFLAKRAGLQVPEESGDQEEIKKRKRILNLNRDAARFYHEILKSPDGQAAREYLEKRKILWKTAVKFGMGASVDEWDLLLRAMTEKGYSKRELSDAGLITPNQNGGFRDKFRNRLMLPVIDTRGDVVAFGSRILDNNNKNAPKYMNSPDIPYQVYSKRKMLYALHLARKTKRKNMILCEGNLDVVTLHQAGFDNAVASMGTALTAEQTKLLSRFTKELILCYDNDAAGLTATEKALKLLENSEFKVRVLRLPNEVQDGKPVKRDPDDFIKLYGADAFEKLLSGSEAGIEFRMKRIAAKYDLSGSENKSEKNKIENKIENKISYGEEISRLIAGLDNPIQREIYINRAAEIGGIDAETISMTVRRNQRRRDPYRTRNQNQKNRTGTGEKNMRNDASGQSGQAPERDANYQEINPSRRLQTENRNLKYQNISSAMAEEGVIRLLLLYPETFPGDLPIRAEDFSVPLLGRAFDILWTAKQRGRVLSPGILEGDLTPEEMSRISGFCQKPESARNAGQALRDYIGVIRRESEKRSGANGQEDILAAATRKYKNKK